jgi:predicted amidohydrolase YtcJ
VILFHNGVVLTQDPETPHAEALAVDGERIAAVGSWADLKSLAGAGTRTIDLDGGVVLPGFNDAHVHVWKLGQLLTSIVDLRPVRSLDALARMARTRHAELADGAWLLGRGYNEALMTEGRQPTRYDLDAVARDRPIAMTRTCGHMMVVNTRALELSGIDTNTAPPPGGFIERDERGEATGLVQETAMGLVKAVMPDPSVSDYADMIVAANEAQLRNGITSVSEAGAYPDIVNAYRDLDTRRGLMVRANVMAMRLAGEQVASFALPERFVSDFLRVDSVKLFADGGLSGGTAALMGDYRNAATRGLLRVEPDELYAMSRSAADAGLRVCTHAIGDAAIECVLATYERLGRPGNRIEHCGLPNADQLERAKSIGAMVAAQTVFIHSLGPNFRHHLNDDYLKRCYPIRSMLDAGLVVALSSDAPVIPDDNPLVGIQAAVTRLDRQGVLIAPSEAVSVEEALYAYTMGGALASGDGDNRGSLTPGKWADLVVLDRNPLGVAHEELTEIRVVQSFVGGELRHRA